jgi:enoyl-CoA hydratase/carnithine racemase
MNSSLQDTEELLFHVDNGVATLTLNRPHEGNALTPAC